MLGQALIEVLVSIALASLIIATSTVAIIGGLSNAVSSKNQATAAEYAQEGLSDVKAEQAANPQDFSSSITNQDTPSTSSTFCIDNQGFTAPDGSSNPNGNSCDPTNFSCISYLTASHQVNSDNGYPNCSTLPPSPGLGSEQKFLR